MALGINTNVASINAQNQLSKSQSLNDQALERLSSGLRINSAKDDAAGLAISTRFEAQINGLDQASRNANDGISLAQTAEGGLDEITNNLQRVRELAVQSANATNSASDREALNDEVQQRIEEIDRIAGTTAFNGLNVLDGSLDTQDFQVGANAGETISVDLNQGAKADQVGAIATAEVNFADATSGATFAGGGSFELTVGDSETETVSIEEGASAADIAETVEGQSIQGINTISADSEGLASFAEDITGGTGGGTYSINIALGDDSETISVNVAQSGTLSGADMAEAINEQGPEGLTASFDGSTGGGMTLTADTGENISVSGEQTTNVTGTGFGAPDATYVGNVTIDANDQVTVGNTADNSIDTVTDGNTSGSTTLAASTETSLSTAGALEDVTVSTVDDANDAIKRADAALDAINSIRSELGAVQNRFESTIANLDNNIENLEASNSRIKDADFAAESAKLAQSQVLQQAGISVLAQANQRPQQVLSLLQ